MMWDFLLWYLQVEVDEEGETHEDCRERLKVINNQMGGRPGVVLRIDTDKLVTRKRKRDGSYVWGGAKYFSECIQEVCDFIRENTPIDSLPCALARANRPRVVTLKYTK
jgi:hypothetical protein